MINLLKRSCRISAWFLCCACSAIAQEKPRFTWEAALPEVSAPGFYQIPITPALAAKAYRDGAWDIRIYGGAAEIPYLATPFFEIVTSGDFKAYPMPKLASIPGKETVIIFEQAPQKTINEFGLRYTNTDVSKKARLTGSPDMVQWFAVKEDFRLMPAAAKFVEGKPGIVEETIVIPVSGFRYFKLQIDDSASAPLQINCVGFRSEPQQRPMRQEVPGVQMRLLPGKDRRTDRFLLTLPYAAPLSAVSMLVPRPQLFHRDAALLAVEAGKERHLSAKLLHSTDGYQVIPLLQAGVYDSLILQVDNGDNPPLEPEQPKAWQDKWEIVVKLDPGHYVLKGGDRDLHIPSYDIRYFKEAYRAEEGMRLIPGEPKMIAGVSPAPAPDSVFTSRAWVWLGILLVVGILALVVRGMIREMKKREK